MSLTSYFPRNFCSFLGPRGKKGCCFSRINDLLTDGRNARFGGGSQVEKNISKKSVLSELIKIWVWYKILNFRSRRFRPPSLFVGPSARLSRSLDGQSRGILPYIDMYLPIEYSRHCIPGMIFI